MSTKKIEHPQENFDRNDRVIHAVDALSLKRSEIIEKVPCSRTLLSRILNKKWKVSDSFAVRFCDRFGVSREWVKDGTGEMLITKTDQEAGQEEKAKTSNESTEAGRRAEEIVNSLSYENQYLAIQILTRLKESEKVVAKTH